jgi:hypothetical protein
VTENNIRHGISRQWKTKRGMGEENARENKKAIVVERGKRLGRKRERFREKTTYIGRIRERERKKDKD